MLYASMNSSPETATVSRAFQTLAIQQPKSQTLGILWYIPSWTLFMWNLERGLLSLLWEKPYLSKSDIFSWGSVLLLIKWHFENSALFFLDFLHWRMPEAHVKIEPQRQKVTSRKVRFIHLYTKVQSVLSSKSSKVPKRTFDSYLRVESPVCPA